MLKIISGQKKKDSESGDIETDELSHLTMKANFANLMSEGDLL
jgi:hypothetical protein